jgi:hypothetical protein
MLYSIIDETRNLLSLSARIPTIFGPLRLGYKGLNYFNSLILVREKRAGLANGKPMPEYPALFRDN